MIKSVTGFIDKILSQQILSGQVVTYRGHANTIFKLTPSIFRDEFQYENEHILIRELIAAYPDDFAQDVSALEMLVRMQHFSLPTRLLDVSFNPLVALYFACAPSNNRSTSRAASGLRTTATTKAHGEVIALITDRKNVKYFDSDTVSCLTNLSRLSIELKRKINTNVQKLEFNSSLPVRRLLHFIKQEKSGFEDDIDPSHMQKIILVKPKQNNRRILAQAGAFFVFGLGTELSPSDVVHIERIIIDADNKGKIREQLDRLGINEKSLFPDIERAARYLISDVEQVAIRRIMGD